MENFPKKGNFVAKEIFVSICVFFRCLKRGRDSLSLIMDQTRKTQICVSLLSLIKWKMKYLVCYVMISSTADCHKAKTTALTFMTENVSVNSSQTFAQCSVELWEAKPAPGVIDFFGGDDRVGSLDPLNMLYIMYITLYI